MTNRQYLYTDCILSFRPRHPFYSWYHWILACALYLHPPSFASSPDYRRSGWGVYLDHTQERIRVGFYQRGLDAAVGSGDDLECDGRGAGQMCRSIRRLCDPGGRHDRSVSHSFLFCFLCGRLIVLWGVFFGTNGDRSIRRGWLHPCLQTIHHPPLCGTTRPPPRRPDGLGVLENDGARVVCGLDPGSGAVCVVCGAEWVDEDRVAADQLVLCRRCFDSGCFSFVCRRLSCIY